MKITKTNRGFDLAEFTDRNGAACTLQKSSIATEDCIWLGVEDADPKIMAVDAPAAGVETNESTGWVPYPIPDAVFLTTRMHLNRRQVKALLPMLQKFAESGDIR